MRKGAESTMAAQASVGGPSAAGERHDPAPHHGGSRGRHRHEEGDDQIVAAERVDGRDEHRHADRVNRVDLAIDAARQVVRVEIAREVLGVVPARVVVLDAQIAVAPQALGDDEIVRLVAGREEHRVREAAGGKTGGGRREQPDGRGLRAKRAARAPVGEATQAAATPSTRAARRRAPRSSTARDRPAPGGRATGRARSAGTGP